MSASLARSALVLFGLALGVLCAEGALHVLGPRLPGLYNLATFQAYHPIYGFFHRPGARGWVRTDEFTSYVQINSRGLRDREVAIPKPAQTFRLLVLGDSIVEGSQVALDQTLPKQLEQLLGGGPGRPLEAINAGNAGFGTAQELLFLQHDGPAYGPDVVVLVFYVDNDAANNGIGVAQKRGLSTAGRPFFVLDSDGNLLQVPVASMPPEPLGQLKDVLRNSSLLYDVGENLLTARAAAKQYHAVRMDKDRTMYLIEPPREWQDAWAVTEALLERARESASAIGAELVVVAAPSQFQVYESDWLGGGRRAGWSATPGPAAHFQGRGCQQWSRGPLLRRGWPLDAGRPWPCRPAARRVSRRARPAAHVDPPCLAEPAPGFSPSPPSSWCWQRLSGWRGSTRTHPASSMTPPAKGSMPFES